MYDGDYACAAPACTQLLDTLPIRCARCNTQICCSIRCLLEGEGQANHYKQGCSGLQAGWTPRHITTRLFDYIERLPKRDRTLLKDRFHSGFQKHGPGLLVLRVINADNLCTMLRSTTEQSSVLALFQYEVGRLMSHYYETYKAELELDAGYMLLGIHIEKDGLHIRLCT